MPQRGPEPSRRMLLAMCISATAVRLSAPEASTIGVVRGERLELVLGGDERVAGQLGDLRGHALGEARGRVEAGADGGAAERQLGAGAAGVCSTAAMPLRTWAA